MRESHDPKKRKRHDHGGRVPDMKTGVAWAHPDVVGCANKISHAGVVEEWMSETWTVCFRGDSGCGKANEMKSNGQRETASETETGVACHRDGLLHGAVNFHAARMYL